MIQVVSSVKNFTIGTCACPPPNANMLWVKFHYVGRIVCKLYGRCTKYLAESPVTFTCVTSPLYAPVASEAKTHVAFVTDRVHSPIRASTRTSPYTKRGSHDPVNCIFYHILSREWSFWDFTPKCLTKHFMRHAELVVWCHDNVGLNPKKQGVPPVREQLSHLHPHLSVSQGYTYTARVLATG